MFNEKTKINVSNNDFRLSIAITDDVVISTNMTENELRILSNNILNILHKMET